MFIIKINYRELVQELFGTDDPEELRQIAESLHRKNTRNAGRKKKYNEHDVLRMKELRANGVGMQEIADAFGTSRQVISRYLARVKDSK